MINAKLFAKVLASCIQALWLGFRRYIVYVKWENSFNFLKLAMLRLKSAHPLILVSSIVLRFHPNNAHIWTASLPWPLNLQQKVSNVILSWSLITHLVKSIFVSTKKGFWFHQMLKENNKFFLWTLSRSKV